MFGEAERDALICAEAVGALMALPRHQWRHILVVVDEAQTLAPQTGSGGASLAALTDLALRGRKRGLGLVVATGRLALLDKSLLAMCSNRLVGLTTLGNDVKRAAEELGFSAAERGALKRRISSIRASYRGDHTPSFRAKLTREIKELERERETLYWVLGRDWV